MYSKCIAAIALVALTPPLRENTLTAQQTRPAVLTPRQIGRAERNTLANAVARRFQERVPPNAEIRAAGSYRFISTSSFHYADRSDLGSVAFELDRYGNDTTGFDSSAVTRADLLKRVDSALTRAQFRADGRLFSAFQDEFAGSTGPSRGLSIQIAPRSNSRHVARTVEYRRVSDGVPVFGSELLVGFTRDGRIGRFRMHWPAIPEAVLRQAGELQKSVAQNQWATPSELRGSEIEVLEVSAGVGHSAFADPEFKIAPVVRVVYRKRGKNREYSLSSTSYKYFDGSGKEVLFSNFPAVPATSPTLKRPSR
jgi:hypothetical protein